MENLIFEKDNQIAIITINRPKAKNALNRKTYEEFDETIKNIKEDSSIRALIIKGVEGSFCSGIDVSFLAELKKMSQSDFLVFMKKVQGIFAFENLNIPVISAVNGYALGNGCEIALASDFIIASKSAKFCMSYVNLGFVPDLGGTFRLQKLVGLTKARELILTGATISAEKAETIGMVTKVVADDKIEDKALEFAKTFTKKSPIAICMAKKAISNSSTNELEGSLEFEALMQNICMQSNDSTEAINAFMEKRDPRFSGS